MELENQAAEMSRVARLHIGMMLSALLVLLIAAVRLPAQTNAKSPPRRPRMPLSLYNPPYPNDPVKPFRIIGNIYYVGRRVNFTSYLITTPAGHFLLDTEGEQFVPNIRDNIEALGFHVKDVKIILLAHAHVDHVGGVAAMKELTGAQVLMMAQDADALADGGKSRSASGKEQWKPVRADRVIHDGEKIQLGGVTMTAQLTAGHTPGCTTWTTVAEENGRKYNAVFICSMRINDPLVGNKQFPNISEAFAKSFQTLKSLPCDVFLASHGFMFNLEEKLERMEQGTGSNPFIDPQGYRDYIANYEKAYRDELQYETAQAGAPQKGSRPGY